MTSRETNGFKLVELLVVTAVIGILITLVSSAYLDQASPATAAERAAPLFQQQVLFQAGDLGYKTHRIPSPVVTDQGTILCLYETDTVQKLTLVRFNAEWLTDGEDTLTPRSEPSNRSAATAAAAAEYRVVRSFKIAASPACMPALTRAPNGDLLAAFGTEWEPFPWGGMVKLTVSRDGGTTWSGPRVLWKDEDPRVTIQVANGLQALSNGDVLMPVTHCLVPKRTGVSPDEKLPHKIYDLGSPDCHSEVRLLRSQDSGKTWTMEDVKLKSPCCRFGRLVETPDGRLLMPGFGWYVESRDLGKTWGPRLSLNTPFSSETNLIVAANGTLLSILRQDDELGGPRRVFGTNFSHDGGITWGPSRLTGIRGKMPDLLVLPSGRILLAVGMEGLADGSDLLKHPQRPSACTLFFSDDHGKTWQRDIAFAQAEPGSTVVPCDSPVMCALDDGRILVVMEAFDRALADHPLAGYSAGMSIIGNVIEHVQHNQTQK